MGAAAKLHREVPDAQYPHVLIVLLPKQRHRTRGYGVVVAHQLGLCGGIRPNLAVHEPLDLQKLFRRDRLEMRKVEAQPIGRNQRSLLLHVRTQDLPQCGMQQMGCRVIECSRAASRSIHVSAERLPHPDAPFGNPTDVGVRCAALLCVFYDESHSPACKLARVADLTARFRIERRAIENDLALLSRGQLVNDRPSLEKRDHMTFRLEPVISLEHRARINRRASAKINSKFAGLLRASALFVHRRPESLVIDIEAALARNVRGEIGRESVRVVQLENCRAIDHGRR